MSQQSPWHQAPQLWSCGCPSHRILCPHALSQLSLVLAFFIVGCDPKGFRNWTGDSNPGPNSSTAPFFVRGLHLNSSRWFPPDPPLCAHCCLFVTVEKAKTRGKMVRKHVGAMSSAMSSYEWRRANARVGRSLHHYLFKTAGKGELARAQGVISEKKKCSTGCASRVWCVGGQWRQGCRRC